jgi:hypothetical protein
MILLLNLFVESLNCSFHYDLCGHNVVNTSTRLALSYTEKRIGSFSEIFTADTRSYFDWRMLCMKSLAA